MNAARSVRVLEVVCLAFAALGLVLPWALYAPPFVIYRGALADHVGEPSLVLGSPTLTWCLGMTGGSIAGKWIAHWAVVRFGLRRGDPWAWRATWAGLLAWFVLDSVASLLHGAWANVVMINGAPLLAVVPCLVATRSSLRDTPTPGRSDRRPAMRAAFVGSLIGMGSGVMIAALGDTAIFEPVRDALGAAHFGGPLPPSGRALLGFFLGPIGGTTLGHFVLVAALVRHAEVIGERRALGWALASVLVWFVFDSTISAATGAWFNLWMVNVPALIVTTAPLAWAFVTAPRPSGGACP